MSLPKFNPWSLPKGEPIGAYRACRAYSAVPLGTLGTIGTEDRSDRQFARLSCLVAEWRGLLIAAINADPTGERTSYLQAALVLCEGPWIVPLLALGWTGADIFSCDNESRRGGLAYGLVGGVLVAATVDAAYLMTSSGRTVHNRERLPPRSWSMIWDLGPDGDGADGN